MSDFLKYAVADLPELTKDEKQNTYADLYYREIAEPAPEVFEAFKPGNQMDPAKAITPEKLYTLLDPNCPTPEMGYCIMPDGTGYTCLVSKLVGAKPEYYDFRLNWVFSEHLGFKIEYPGFHVEHYDGLCIEDCFGTGQNVALILDRNYSPAEMGMPGMPSDINPDIIGFSAHEQDVVPVEGPIDTQTGRGVLILVNKKTDYGIEQWVFQYSGLHIADGKTQVLLGPDEVITEDICRMRGLHFAYEAVNQLQILPAMYEKYKDTMEFEPAKPWPERYRFLQHR